MAICDDYRIIGYNVLVGGGFGVTPSAPKRRFPAIAKRMAFVTPEQVVDVATAVIKVQRDFGNRADRKVARLKYLIAELGPGEVQGQGRGVLRSAAARPAARRRAGFDDHLGWHEQGDGRWFYGLNVENGRIHDRDDLRLKTALREICTRFEPGIRLTAHQSMLFTDVAPSRIGPTWSRFSASNGVKLSQRDLDCPPLVDGLRRLADLRIVDHRSRAGLARR